jgi:Transglutaminase-like superfamily
MNSKPVHWYDVQEGQPHLTRRLRRFLQLFKNPADAWLFMRMISWAMILPILKRLIPLKSLARFLWTPSKTKIRNLEQEQKIATIVRWIYVFVFSSEKSCVERSLLLYHFLSVNNTDPVLATGMRLAEDQVWKGHAWILVDGKPFEETEASVREFRTLMIFGSEGKMRQTDTKIY